MTTSRRMSRRTVVLRLLPLVGFLCFFMDNSQNDEVSLWNRLLQSEEDEQQAKRPTIYTFFELRKDRDGNPDKNNRQHHEDLITAWQDLWYEAGWAPRVLTMEDARQHPDYEHYVQLLIKDRTTENVYEDSYDFMCFMRWLAMANHGGGGFMSDYDTFPMEITPTMGSVELPNYGVFTSYQRHVPALISGSATEWERMAHRVLDMAVAQIDKQIQEGGTNAAREQSEDVFYSDMLALQDLHDMDETSYIQEERVGTYPYKSYLQIDCDAAKNMLAVHLAHSATKYAVEHNLIDVPEHQSEKSRHYFARTLLKRWRDQCKSSTKEVQDQEQVGAETEEAEVVVEEEQQEQQEQQPQEVPAEVAVEEVVQDEQQPQEVPAEVAVEEVVQDEQQPQEVPAEVAVEEVVQDEQQQDQQQQQQEELAEVAVEEESNTFEVGEAAAATTSEVATESTEAREGQVYAEIQRLRRLR